MTLQELYEVLKESRIGNDLILTYTVAEGGYHMLLSAMNLKELVISQARIIWSETELEISGISSFLAFSSVGANDLELRTRVNEYGVITYRVTIKTRGEGTFEDFFGMLPPGFVFDGEKQEYRECAYGDFVISYPTVMIDSETVFDGMPFRVTGVVRPSESGIWGRYVRVFRGSCPAEGRFAIWRDLPEEKRALLDLKLFLTERITLPVIGEAGFFLRLSSIKASVRAFHQDPYVSKSFLVFLASIKNLADDMEFYTELFTGNYYLTLGAMFPEGLSVGNIVNFFASLFGVEESFLLLPENTFVSSFGLKELQMDYSGSEKGSVDSLEHIRVTCGLGRPWDMPVPYVTMESLTVAWEVSRPGQESPLVSLFAAVKLSMNLGKIRFALEAVGYLPQMRFYGELDMQKQPALSDMMESFDVTAPKEWKAGEKLLASAQVTLDVPERMFAVDAYIGDVLEFDIGDLHIALEGIEISAEIASSLFSFYMAGTFGFGEGEDYFSFMMEAEYDQGWLFKGRLASGKVNIGNLLRQMFQLQVSEDTLFRIVLDDFSIEYAVQKESFSLMASFYTSWFTVLGVTPKLGGRILLKKEQEKLYGSALAYIDIEILRLLVQADDFYAENPSYLFRLEFDKLYLQAAYEKNDKKEEILTVSMGGMTLGGLIESFVNLLNPNAKYSLSPPWNILNKIELSRFLLVFNTTKKTFSFLYQVDLNIAGLMQIKRVGLSYEKQYGKGAIRFILTGRLLTDEYTEDAPLSWDVLDEKPPENKAAAGTKLEVYYVGLGQHLDTGGVISSGSITEALNELKKQIAPENSGELPNIGYSEETSWLFGADFKISDMFRFGMVLNDPVLYGALIQVEASDNSPLARFNGLSFELLYKKISDDTGMFRITFMMPERFRRFELGIVTLTVGQVIVEIYTDGSFYIDLGFPHQEDFSKSFGIEFYIYTGKGGVYFGLLKDDAVRSVPLITNGAFSPVILFGLGLRVGLGRSFDLGIVKAGLALELLGVFEGVLAFFKPDEESCRKDPELKEAFYYRVRAKAGVMGSLFLSVDLKIIALSVTAEIMVWCELVLESYRKAEVELALSLKLEAKIKILFFKISFSFHFRQNVSFTFGKDERTPWILQEDAARGRRLEGTGVKRNRLPEYVFCTDKIGNWDISVRYSPLVSVTDLVFHMAETKTPDYCIAFLGVIAQRDFFAFYEMMVWWVLSGWSGGLVSCDEIQCLDSKAEQSVNYDVICRFFTNNLQVHTQLVTAIGNTEEEGGVFPMLAQLILKAGETEIDYGQNLVSGEYIRSLKEYFEGLRTQIHGQSDQPEQMEEKLPFVGVIMTDWVQLILSEIIRRLKKVFLSFEAQTEDIADTAEFYHVSMEKLLLANPSVRLNLFLLPEHTYIVREGDTLASIWEKYALDIEEMWPRIGEQAGLIRQGASFETGDIIFDNKDAGLSVEEAAAFFFVRFHPYGIDGIYSRYADQILRDNPQITGGWECMASGGQPVSLPGGRIWNPLPGDTVERLAKCVLLWEESGEKTGDGFEAWLDFRREFIRQNEGASGSVPELYRFSGTSLIDGDLTLNSLFRRIYGDSFENKESMMETGLWGQAVLSPLSALCLFHAKAEITGTPAEIVGKGVCSMEELSLALEQGGAALQERQSVTVPSVPELSKEKIRELLITEEHSKEILSMVSRFFLQGLRIPKPEEDTGKKIVWDSETDALYKLLRQQIALDQTDEDLVLSLEKGDKECSWLYAEAGERVLTKETVREILPSGTLNIPCEPGQKKDFGKTAKCWTLSQLPELLDYRENEVYYRSVGMLPKDLQGYIRDAKEAPVLRLNQMDTDAFSFGCMIEIELEKEAVEGLYYVYGVKASERQELRGLFESGIVRLRIIYRPSELESDAESYVADTFSDESVLVKTNVSKETHMSPVYRMSRNKEYKYSAMMAQPDNFLRLLWECSVIGGGYYLKLRGARLPEGIWDENNRAKVYILALYDKQIRTGMVSNCIVTEKRAADVTMYSKELLEDVPLLPPGYIGMELNMEKNPEEDTPQGRMDSLYQIVGYRITGGDVRASGDSMPVIPQEGKDGSTQYYPIAVPLYRFAGNGVSFYGAVGKQAEIAVEIRDVLGNRGKLASHTVTGTYNDMVIGVSQIPATALSYTVTSEGDQPMLTIRAAFLADTEAVEGSLELLAAMMWQLDCEGMSVSVVCSFQKEEKHLDEQQFSELKGYVRSVYEALRQDRLVRQVSDFLVSLPLHVSETPEEIVPLSVTVRVKRPADLLNGVEAEGAKMAVSEISPALSGEDMEKEPFILRFEQTFKNIRIAQGAKGWYCVPAGMGLIQNIYVRPYSRTVEGRVLKSPEYYSYLPLSTVRISRKVTVADREGNRTEYSYREIDLDLWMGRFLHELEAEFFSGRTSVMAAELCPELLDGAVTGKEELSEKLSMRLQTLREIPWTGDSGDNIDSFVRKTSADRFKADLERAYDSNVIIVYDAGFNTSSYCRMEMDLDCKTEGLLSPSKLSAKENAVCLFVDTSTRKRTYELDVRAVFSNLEYDINMEKDGYESSEWLKLVHPFSNGDTFVNADFTSDVMVPNPKKECPISPVILSQENLAAGFLKWTYRILCQCFCYEQNSIYIKVRFSKKRMLKNMSGRDLFDVLACYDQRREDILQGLKKDGEEFTAAYREMGEFIEDVTEVFPAAEEKPAETYFVQAEDEILLKVQFALDEEVKFRAELLDGSKEQLEKWGSKIGQINLVSGGTAGEPMQFAVEIENLPIYECQRAKASVWLVQNENIFEESGEKVREGFIYRTEPVSSAELRVYQSYELSHLPQAEENSMEQTIRALWKYMEFDETLVSADMSVWYQYRLVHGEDIGISLPVTFIPNVVNDTVQREKAIAETAENIRSWYRENGVEEGDGYLHFEITVYSREDGQTLLNAGVETTVCS